ncbi:MAG: ATP-dependent helicase [Lachnospiraceae bacterium]|nr:ATP-dependent helicase [Lachnospiraceae bacterium]
MSGFGNPEQQKAIIHGAGPMMVLAGPGSGKTFVLTRRIVHLINTHHITPSEILVITFTRAAASEMQKRFLSLCEGTHPSVTFGTFHAVFYSILKETSVCRAGSILSEQEKKKILRDIIRKNKYNISMHTDMLEELLSEIGRYKNRADISGVQSKTIDFIPNSISPELFFQIYRDFKEAQNILGKVDFDDMALKCEELFQKRPDILKQYQARYRYLLIDEFQDIAPVQYRLVKQLAAPENNLFIVGDDDQSIYGFRGANPDIMKNFPGDYPEAKVVILKTNYRSTPQIVEAAGRLIAHNKNRFSKNGHAAGEPGSLVRVEGYGTADMMESTLIERLMQEKAAGKLSECAVISRTSGIFPLLAEKCRQAGVSCQFRENVKSIFDSEMVNDLLAYLEFSRTPIKDRSRSQFFQFMNRPLRYISREAVNETADFRYMMRFYQGRPAMREQIVRLQQDLERIREMPVFLAISYIRKAMGYDNYLSEKSMPLEEADLIQNSARGCRTLLQWKEMIEERRSEKNTDKTAASADQKKASSEPGVTLITMHGSKGLEYDKVFMINCNEEVTPHKKARSKEEMEEERRMFYVGMTRAKKELTLLYITGETDTKKEGGSAKTTLPSRFLTELQESL